MLYITLQSWKLNCRSQTPNHKGMNNCPLTKNNPQNRALAFKIDFYRYLHRLFMNYIIQVGRMALLALILHFSE